MFQIGIDLQATPRAEPAEAGPAPHVFVVAGGANASGRAPETDAEAFPAAARHWSAADDWAPIGTRLYHGPWETAALARPAPGANFGWARSFAIAYQAAHPDNPVHLIGVARDGSGFGNGLWNQGNPAYAAALARINAAMAALPGNAALKGILWHQGEADSQQQTDRDGYESALNQLIANLRADIAGAAATTPFVTGGHFPVSGLYHPVIQNVNQSLPNRIAHTGYADPSNPAEVALADASHADAPSVHDLGLRYLDGLTEAEANASVAPTGTITTGALAHYLLPRALVSSVAGVALGTPSADRMIVVAVSARADTVIRPLSVRVGGTPLTRAGTPEVDAYLCGMTIYYGRVPAGTSATVEVTFNTLGYNNQAAIAVLPVYGARPHPASATGHATAQSVGNATLVTATVGTDAGDLVLSCLSGISTGLAVSTVNLAQKLTTSAGTTNYGVHSAMGIASSPGDLTVAWAFDRNVIRLAMSALVLKPA